jgi:acyl-CoA synthetase (AMP-forming)/AMP-acid ligase II
VSVNVSLLLRDWAERTPERCAVRTFGRRQTAIGFRALDERVDALAHGLAEHGLARGDRACLFVPPGIDFVALFHALLRLGAVPVLIDPGMGTRGTLACIARAAPRALLGVPRVHWARSLRPGPFRTVELGVRVGRGPAPGAVGLERVLEAGAKRDLDAVVPDGGPAAVLFTSGSTGPAKGVVYTHANFAAQVEALRALYELEPGCADLACFPLFALFDNALGMTSVFPEPEETRPAACDPAAIHRAAEASGARFAFGSPALWKRVLAWAEPRGARFTTLARVTTAGAPVAPALALGLRRLLPPGGEVHVPYGATEALPVSDVTASELERLRAEVEGGAAGSCVGRPAPGIELALIRITDEPIAAWDEGLRAAPGEAGEVCVKGAAVTREYLADSNATRGAKISDGAGVWHRMGDVGRLDDEGRLWFLGRKSQRVETERGTLFPVPLENLFDATPGVARSALVGVGPRGKERAHLVVEPAPRVDRSELLPRLRARAGERKVAAAVEGFLFHRRFPVDARHNAKIHREELKRWAERQLER